MALPKLDVDIPLGSTRTRATLLASIGEIPSESLSDDEFERWVNGVSFAPNPVRDPKFGTTLDPCLPASFTADAYGCPMPIDALPFQAYEGLTAPTLSMTDEQLIAKVQARKANWLSWAFAKQLMSGSATGGSNNLSTGAAGTPPTGAAYGSLATPLYNAVSILEAHLAEKIHNAEGIIHMSPGMLTMAVDECSLIRDGDRFYTQLGNLVIADAGYVTPPPPLAQAAAGVGEDWVYASGPVFYRSLEVERIGDTWQRVNITRNSRTTWTEVYGILALDLEPVTAVLASYRSE